MVDFFGDESEADRLLWQFINFPTRANGKEALNAFIDEKLEHPLKNVSPDVRFRNAEPAQFEVISEENNV